MSIFRQLRLWHAYSENEITKLEQVRSLWKRFFGPGEAQDMTEGAFPFQLQWKSDTKDLEPLCNPTLNELQPSATQLGNGFFTERAREILGHICNYQEVKVNRKGSYYNDPWNLFLEEYKEFVKKLSVQDPGDPQAYLQIRKRKRYVREAWMHIFPPNYDDNMRQTLIEIEKILEVVEKDAYKESHNTSARNLFEQFEKILRKIIKEIMDVLFYGLRNDKELPSTLIIEDIRSDRRQVISGSRIGRLLKYTVELPVFLQIYPTNRNHRSETPLSLRELASEANPFFPKEKGDFNLPIDFFSSEESKSLKIESSSSKSSQHGNNIPTSPHTSSSQFQTHQIIAQYQKFSYSTVLDEKSVYDEFRNNTEFSESFLNLMGYSYEFAKIILFSNRVKDLARLGGDILTYGIARNQLLDLVQVYITLSSKVRKILMNVLDTLAQAAYQLAMKGNSSASSIWFQNYLKLSSSRDNVHDLFIESDRITIEIQSIINTVSLEEWLIKAKDELETFAVQVKAFSNHVGLITNTQIGTQPANTQPNFNINFALKDLTCDVTSTNNTATTNNNRTITHNNNNNNNNSSIARNDKPNSINGGSIAGGSTISNSSPPSPLTKQRSLGPPPPLPPMISPPSTPKFPLSPSTSMSSLPIMGNTGSSVSSSTNKDYNPFADVPVTVSTSLTSIPEKDTTSSNSNNPFSSLSSPSKSTTNKNQPNNNNNDNNPFAPGLYPLDNL
eukprot:TRINITY_DN998_c2_g1_i3.p1 TRINITY_DN998_c2_g1~~TRINITY_DN998_c2_g1_i3.p1  ORF type:complete len:727 (-),score=154.29 TRINITY_DN998_c2_g1_i3:616-2796(-)